MTRNGSSSPATRPMRPGGAERRLLARVADANAEARAVAEVGHEQLGEVPDREGDLVEAVVAELPDHDVEDRPVADRHERLGEDGGVGGEARAEAAGEDDRLHRLHLVPVAGVGVEVLADPGDGAAQALVERHRRRPAEQLPGQRAVAPQALDLARSPGAGASASVSIRTGRPTMATIFSARSPIVVSSSRARFIRRPSTPGALPARTKPSTVSVTKLRSRVGESEPRRTTSPRSAWTAIVGMTARVDWRGP